MLHYTQQGVDILARKIRLVMNCSSFIDHAYSSFIAILSSFIALNTLEAKYNWGFAS